MLMLRRENVITIIYSFDFHIGNKEYLYLHEMFLWKVHANGSLEPSTSPHHLESNHKKFLKLN